MIPLRICLTIAFAVTVVMLQSARACAQTKITIGAAAMSPRTIPLLIAQDKGCSPGMASKRASC